MHDTSDTSRPATVQPYPPFAGTLPDAPGAAQRHTDVQTGQGGGIPAPTHGPHSAACANARLKIVRRMFQVRFGEKAPDRRSVDQLRGIEGVRVRIVYQGLAQQFGVHWQKRRYDPWAWDVSDVPNRCLSAATACLYGITEAAVLAAGYAPAVGFLHTGKPLSFVYDVADVFKFDTVVPEAFRVAGLHASDRLRGGDPVREVRLACRNAFRRTHLLRRLIRD